MQNRRMGITSFEVEMMTMKAPSAEFMRHHVVSLNVVHVYWQVQRSSDCYWQNIHTNFLDHQNSDIILFWDAQAFQRKILPPCSRCNSLRRSICCKSTGLHGVASQKITIFIVTTVTHLNATPYKSHKRPYRRKTCRYGAIRRLSFFIKTNIVGTKPKNVNAQDRFRICD